MTDKLTDRDSDCFVRLLLKNEPSLRIYARMMLPRWDAIDDVIQEASAVMWRKFDTLDDPVNFLPWAKAVVRFEAFRYRRDKARDRLVFCEDVYDVLLGETTARKNPGGTERLDALRKCMSTMAENYQELLLAPYLGQGRVKQMAMASGRTANSLYKLLTRLRGKLIQCVESHLAKISGLEDC